MTITFGVLVSAFSGRFTYSYNVGCLGLGCGGITIQAFNGANNPLVTAQSFFASNLALSGDPGSSPNELFQFFWFNAPGISRVTITADPAGGSFTLDDLTYEPMAAGVPEPASWVLVAAGLAMVKGLLRA